MATRTQETGLSGTVVSLTPKRRIPLARPDLGPEEIAAVVECLKSGSLTNGPRIRQFEAAFAAFLGAGAHTVAVNSNSMGLLLALDAFGVGAGDEVITTTTTFIATALAILHVGAKPVLVDIDPLKLTIDATKIEAAITSRTKAIIPVHMAGLACDMEAITAIARRHGLCVIEDAAHSLPTICGGRLVGNHTADATVFSFYATKTITAGEGGMIATPHKDIARRLKLLRLHGIDKDIFEGGNSRPPWAYDVLAAGHKANMPDTAAAIGIEQLKKLWLFYRRRTAIVRRYNEAFQDLPLVLPADAPPGDAHAWHLYIVQLKADAPISRDRFIQGMAQRSIQCGVHFIPLHRLSYFRDGGAFAGGPFPHADKVFEHCVSLPLSTTLSDSDVEYVISRTRRLLADPAAT